MRDTKHTNSLKRNKFYYFKYCADCGDRYKPTSGGDYCDGCKKKRIASRYKNKKK